MITPNNAPNPADRNAYDSASVARPCLAIGWPSNVVATDDGSPGMLNRIDVVEPPNSAPQYMLASRMMADTGSMLNVSGISSVTPLGAPSPGSTPTRIPNSTPASISEMWYGVSATANPCISSVRFSIYRSFLNRC